MITVYHVASSVVYLILILIATLLKHWYFHFTSQKTEAQGQLYSVELSTKMGMNVPCVCVDTELCD